MPLLDHFHPPLYPRRHWESFHTQWASCIAASLNASLPDDFFAEAQRDAMITQMIGQGFDDFAVGKFE